jgi:AGZA family xanthine/uracil permease-like MFS transporter
VLLIIYRNFCSSSRDLRDLIVVSRLGAPALIVVGIVMLSVLSRMNLEDPLQVIPLAITVGFMIFTYNITLGIAASLVAYPLVAIAVGKAREVR